MTPNGVAPNGSFTAIGTTAADAHFGYDELSKSWFGAFSMDQEGYYEAGDCGITKSAGSVDSNNQTGNDNAFAQFFRDPLRRRFTRLNYRAPGTTVGAGSSFTSPDTELTVLQADSSSGLHGASGETGSNGDGGERFFWLQANSSNQNYFYTKHFR